jgi:DNA phosphorothioation-dependent restriction protein DptG
MFGVDELTAIFYLTKEYDESVSTWLQMLTRYPRWLLVFLSMTNKMQLYNTLYYCQRCTCFERFCRSPSGAQICTFSIRYLSILFAVTAGVDELGLYELAVTANKFDKCLMLHVQI